MSGKIKVARFTHYNEPYGTVHMVDCTWEPIQASPGDRSSFVYHCEQQGLGQLTGTVESGGETSRLLWCFKTRDLKGLPWSVWAVSKQDLEAGYKTTVAM